METVTVNKSAAKFETRDHKLLPAKKVRRAEAPRKHQPPGMIKVPWPSDSINWSN
jgi:hypothetical protein